MTTGSLLLAIAILFLVILLVARPFILPDHRDPVLTERDFLEAEKSSLLAQIQALDFDNETGKQGNVEHLAERERLLQQAEEVLRQLDETKDVDALIEATVKRLIEAEKTNLQAELPDELSE